MNSHLKLWLVDSRRLVPSALLALLGLCVLVFWNQLGSLGLMDKTEGLFVEIPRQMLLSGDWVTPHWNGQTFFDYPVWGYWMVALSFQVFGVTEWAARVPTALAATITVLSLFGVVLRYSSEAEPIHRRVSRATLAGTLLALSPGWVGWARASVTDMFLASAISLSLFGFLLAFGAGPRLGQRRLGHVALALFSGIAVLAKGPIGLLLPGLVIMVFLILKGQFLKEIRSTPWLAMGSLFLGVTIPWYWAATQANGWDFLQRFIGYSNFQRFTSVIYSHPGPPWFYLPWLLLLLFPWSLFLPVALARLRFWQLNSWKADRSAADLPLLACLWLLVTLIFFSAAATKLAGYILPVLPAGALLVSLMFYPLQVERPFGRGLQIAGWVNAALLATAALAAALLPWLLRSSQDFPNFNISFLGAVNPTIWSLCIGLAVFAIVLLLRTPEGLGKIWIPNVIVIITAITFALPSIAPIVDRERLKPVRELARIAGQFSELDQPLIVVGFKRYSSIFYSNRTALFVSRADQVLEAYLRSIKFSSKGFDPFDRVITASAMVLLLGTDRELRRFGLMDQIVAHGVKSSQPLVYGGSSCQLLARRSAHLLLRCPVEMFFTLKPQV